ncbi:uncharacterized protein LOC129914525 [Episyrphus balteatus]|uniref:uncharacterized protein LOC129914525 n=1 Tax=Episyrphus balteatus TaxID=286459 RepID=UPI002485DD16|nr:uncharacterized protein LOC129914525 [Episyrphus balteatus]
MDNRQRFLLTTLLIIIISEVKLNYALLLKCPVYQLHFQKIVGFRPPAELMTEGNVLYAADPTNPFDLINPICWDLCKQDENCLSYILNLDTNQCFGFSIFELSNLYQQSGQDIELIADNNAIYFEKTCLKVPASCNTKMWILTKMPGSSLVLQGKKTIPNLVTRRECAERCLFENEFPCLSASFAPSYKNNQARLSEQMPQIEKLGRCVLSDKDKVLQPDAFRAAPFDEEYIENQCQERPIERENCSYELYSNSTFIYAEARHNGLTQKECQASCSSETKFYCQGVSYFLDQLTANSECYLHSEDIISMGPRSLKFKPMSVYMRRVKCLDVSVICSNEEMVVKYSPSDWFRGKIYVSAHSEDCMTMGNGTRSTLLRLPIGNEIQEKRCGILRAYEVTKNYQRIFISAMIVVQNNLNVQTQGDRLVKVGCIISNSTVTEAQLPSAIALESSFAFTQNELPSEGFIHFNESNLELPKISMQVIDLNQQYQTNDVQIGQSLELQISAEPPDTPFDFDAISLVAKSSNNTSLIVLIDEMGCPTDVTVFPALTKVTTNEKKMLYARFQAFKFAGNSLVSFDVKINFCPARCPPIMCQRSMKRNRRFADGVQLYGDTVQVKSPIYVSTVMEQVVNSNLTDDGYKTPDSYLNGQTVVRRAPYNLELPLNYDINVRGPNIVDTKGLIYGERGIVLIAGVDESSMDNICINQSLLIAMLIFWLIFQVALMFSCCYLIQKYKRLASLDEERRKIQDSIDYYEGRRVHWADQGGYTL